MKRLFTSFLGAVCLFALSACSDEETPAPQPGSGDTEELPALPSEVVKDGRAMWVSYDPTPDADANSAPLFFAFCIASLFFSDTSPYEFNKVPSKSIATNLYILISFLFFQKYII